MKCKELKAFNRLRVPKENVLCLFLSALPPVQRQGKVGEGAMPLIIHQEDFFYVSYLKKNDPVRSL